MKKLILLLAVLTLTACNTDEGSDYLIEPFIIKSVKRNTTKDRFKQEYIVEIYPNSFYSNQPTDPIYYYTNKKYSVGDTLK